MIMISPQIHDVQASINNNLNFFQIHQTDDVYRCTCRENVLITNELEFFENKINKFKVKSKV